jgi:putative nucleotidyltransferase with HDIG domain
MQIRRQTEPLEELSRGTVRLAEGDFTTPVKIQSRDEFADLARSFNHMAGSLDRQITSLRNLDALHQAVLGARELKPLVDTAVGRFGAMLPGTEIMVAIAAPDEHLEICGVWGRSWNPGALRIALTADERTQLRFQARQIVMPATVSRTYVDVLPFRSDYADVLVLPLWRAERLLGLVVVGLTRTGQLDGESCELARRLADRLAIGVADVQLVQHLDALSSGTIVAFARAIDAVSPWTAGHSERVTAFALQIGQRLHLGENDLDVLKRGGLLHDIGKIGVRGSVLNKAGPLDEDERANMELHPVIGSQILEPIGSFADVIPIVRSHHERIDGRGYPDRLGGEQIHPLARILAVADVFDALVSDRPYRTGMPITEAVSIIRGGAGTHFEPRVVAAFLGAISDGVMTPILSGHREAVELANRFAEGRGISGAAA